MGLDDAGPGSLDLDEVYVTQTVRSTLAYTVEWTTDAPADTELEIVCESGMRTSFVDPTLETAHALFVMGLVPRDRCDLELRSADAEGRRGSRSESIQVDQVPRSFPARSGISVPASEPDRMQPGWTLVSLMNLGSADPIVIALVDEDGRYRWYYSPGDYAFNTGVNEVSVQPEGILIGATGENDLQLVGWDGATLWSGSSAIAHHDIRRYPDAGHVTTLHNKGTCFGNGIAGGVIRVDMDTGDEVWRWNVCDHFTAENPPPATGHDWAHLNTFQPTQEPGDFLLSYRNIDSVTRVSEATGEIRWRLGPEGDFDIEPDAVFYRQHSAIELPSGNILMFDNGHEELRPTSRALEVRLDMDAMTAELAWAYEAPEGWFRRIWGDADRLANGNTLIGWGNGPPPGERCHVEEVTPEGERVWLLELPLGWATYRADRVDVPALVRRLDSLP